MVSSHQQSCNGYCDVDANDDVYSFGESQEIPSAVQSRPNRSLIEPEPPSQPYAHGPGHNTAKNATAVMLGRFRKFVCTNANSNGSTKAYSTTPTRLIMGAGSGVGPASHSGIGAGTGTRRKELKEDKEHKEAKEWLDGRPNTEMMQYENVVHNINQFRQKYIAPAKPRVPSPALYCHPTGNAALPTVFQPPTVIRGRTAEGRPTVAKKDDVGTAANLRPEGDKVISFSSSKRHLEVEGPNEREDILQAARAGPFALMLDEVKPLFFFNVKPGNEEEDGPMESDFNTPSFIETFREDSQPAEAAEDKQHEAPPIVFHGPAQKALKECGTGKTRCKPGNGEKPNIFISKTTIINNIIKAKGAPKLDNIVRLQKRNVPGFNDRMSKSYISSVNSNFYL